MNILLLPLWLLLAATPAKASCECACVDGIMRPVCTQSTDVEPICHPRVCAVVPPSIAPIQVDPVPPPNSEECEQHQVYDELSEEYVWRTLCE